MILDEDAAARRAGALLARLAHLHAGERVAVLAGNGPWFVAARDAATAAGLVLIPINPRLAPAEVAWIVTHARPRLVFADRPIDLPVPVVALDGDGPAVPLDPRAGATILYTSGTTGRPKGCWRGEAPEAARLAELRASYALTRDDTHLIVCPLAHSAPGAFLRAARGVGAKTAIAERFVPELFVDDVRTTGATIVFLVPTQAHRLLALPPPRLNSLRAVVVAGAPFAPAQKAAFADWIGRDRLYEFYGSSETGTISVIGPEDRRPGSVGRPPPGVTVRVVDGELFVRSPAVMDGYLTDDGAGVVPAPEYISVGDLGTIDGDGYITLVDRKHDTIITGGMNVYPAEVERALAALGVASVVFGIPDDDWGQLVAAVIACDTPFDVRAALRDQLAGYKLPRAAAWCALADLPIGSSGKALRRAAREQFASRLARID